MEFREGAVYYYINKQLHELLTTKEYAEILGITPVALNSRRKRNTVKKCVRFDRNYMYLGKPLKVVAK